MTEQPSRAAFVSLVCPETRLALELCSMADAEARVGAPLVARPDVLNAKGRVSTPVGRTPWVLLRDDRACAYPIVDGIPILLVPEALAPTARQRTPDITLPKYAEAYEEMEFYNEAASQEARRITLSESYSVIAPALGASDAEKASFPDPRERWIDAVYDCASQWDAYRHLGPIQGRSLLQLGGKGAHAVKFLLAGAGEAWSVTPMIGEARWARALGEEVGVADRLRCVVAVAEELPIESETFDAVYSGGCLHHMQTELALPEAARVLRPGGKFAAVDPWRAPLYAVGTKLLGKREAVYCVPLTKTRVAPASQAFRIVDVVQHGTITRYPLLALSKFKVGCSLTVAWYCNRIDDSLCSIVPGMRAMGSSVALLGSK